MKNLILGMIFTTFTLSANATIVTSTVGSYDGVEWAGVDITYDLDDFIFDLQGESIVSATLTGVWGLTDTYPSEYPDVEFGSTAHSELYVDGLLVADTHDPELAADPYWNIVDWSFTFTDFSLLTDGSLDFVAIQTSDYVMRLGETTLTIETVSVPEPGVLALLGLGLVGISLSRKKKYK